MTAASFARIVHRSPMAPGSTGAPFERVRLSDGSSYVVKHVAPADDAVMRVLRDRGSIQALWDNAIFSRLPPPLASSVLDVEEEPNGWAILMPDLSDHLIADDRVISRSENTRILTALNGMHEGFRGERIIGLCSHRDKLELNSPRMIKAEAWSDPLYPPEVGRDGREWPFTRAVQHGWDLFYELVNPEVVAGIRAIHHDPDPLARSMSSYDTTIIHGDLQFPNMALAGDSIYLLDWGSASIHGTAEEDFAWYLMANEWQIDATHEELMADFVQIRGSDYASEAFDLASIFIVALMGWRLGWEAVEESDDAIREHSMVAAEWWRARTRDALSSWAQEG